MILSQLHYMYFVTFMTAGMCAAWIVVDSIRLRRALRDDTSDPVVRDRVFGSLIGLAVCTWGILGCLDYWGYLHIGS